MNDVPLISVCVCSYRRPDALSACLKSIVAQDINAPLEVIVADDDAQQSAAPCVTMMRPEFTERGIELVYVNEPHRNIALARNTAVSWSHSPLIAFIDDDETAHPSWLSNLYKTLRTYDAVVVIGPVLPVIPDSFPTWVGRSGAFDRPRMLTGARVRAVHCRTGNVLARRTLFESEQFDARLGRTGGSDWMLFRQLERKNVPFHFCAEAVVFETQEACRASLRWQLTRGYRGGWGYAYVLRSENRVCKAVVAAVRSSILGTGKVILQGLLKLSDPRAAGLFWLRGMAAQAGKIGFFIFSQVEEYKERR